MSKVSAGIGWAFRERNIQASAASGVPDRMEYDSCLAGKTLPRASRTTVAARLGVLDWLRRNESRVSGASGGAGWNGLWHLARDRS